MIPPRRWARLALSLAASVFAACVPAVAHGPRVKPGVEIGGTASLTAGPRYTEGDDGDHPFLYGPLGANFGYGWVSSSAQRPALRLGLHAPVPVVQLVQPDVYVQLPRGATPGVQAGAGVSWWAVERGRVAMPYLRLGRVSERGALVHDAGVVAERSERRVLRPPAAADRRLGAGARLPAGGGAAADPRRRHGSGGRGPAPLRRRVEPRLRAGAAVVAGPRRPRTRTGLRTICPPVTLIAWSMTT